MELNIEPKEAEWGQVNPHDLFWNVWHKCQYNGCGDPNEEIGSSFNVRIKFDGQYVGWDARDRLIRLMDAALERATHKEHVDFIDCQVIDGIKICTHPKYDLYTAPPFMRITIYTHGPEARQEWLQYNLVEHKGPNVECGVWKVALAGLGELFKGFGLAGAILDLTCSGG